MLQVWYLILSCVQILDVALGCVLSADLGDLPTVLKFIMQQVSSRNALEVSCLLQLYSLNTHHVFPLSLSFLTSLLSSLMLLVTGVQIISELREKLDFGSTFTPHPAASSTPRGTQRYANK